MFGPNKNRGFQSSLRRLSGQRRAGLARNKRRLGLEQLDPRLMLATSVEAVLLDFEFDGQVLTDTVADYEDEIYKQLLYTVGQLNGDNSVGRIGEVELSEIVVEEATLISDDTDGYRISYHARFPVAWGQPREVPTEYTFKVPSEVTWLGNMYFVGMHYDSCVWEYTAGLAPDTYYWYYRANAEGCELVPELTREMTAVVTPGGQTTTGTYPDMHKIWEDGTLQVVAVFGA